MTGGRMSQDLNTRQRYVLLKRRGFDDQEAAERAGFAGRPGPDARRLEGVLDEESGAADPGERLLELREEVTKLEYELERARERLEAMEVLRYEKSNGDMKGAHQ